jgi:hypothetical protein
MLDRIWFALCERAEQAAREERGDTLVTWLIVTLGIGAAAAAVIAVLSPALKDAGGRIVSLLSP